jgi:hypothetical protein
MEIEPTRMGAVLDVTDVVDQVLEMVAEAMQREPIRVERLLFGLRDAVEARGKRLEAQAAGRSISPELLEELSSDVDANRDALAGLLVGRVVLTPTSAGCLQYGKELTAAGKAARARHWTPGQPAEWLAGQERKAA